jgi:hypothetical protein
MPHTSTKHESYVAKFKESFTSCSFDRKASMGTKIMFANHSMRAVST